MKFKFNFLAIAATVAVLVSAALPASAQLGVDTFHPTRNVAVGNVTVFNAAAQGPTTNGPVDLANFSGFSTFTLFSATNAGNSGSVTLQVYTSNDKTNWVNLPTYALLSSTTAFSFTNGYYGGTNLITTNSTYLPGTITVPVAATSLFSTPYLLETPYTNTATSITVNPNGLTIIGFQKTDASRYFEYSVTPINAAATNSTTYGWFTSYPIQPDRD